MADLNQPSDILMPPTEKPKLPGSLNVLTILTFIGCGVFGLFTFLMPTFLSWSLKMMDKAQQDGKLTDKQAVDMDKSRLSIETFLAHKWPLLIVGLIGIGLCLYGAIAMRKLKKEGFYIYVIGQILPIIGGVVLLGFANQFNGVFSYIVGLGVPILFIILYANNLKHLK